MSRIEGRFGSRYDFYAQDSGGGDLWLASYVGVTLG